MSSQTKKQPAGISLMTRPEMVDHRELVKRWGGGWYADTDTGRDIHSGSWTRIMIFFLSLKV